MSNPYDFAFPGVNLNGGQEVGLTKREYFAAVALEGLLAQETEDWRFDKPEQAAKRAVTYADALLAALEEPRK